MWTAGKLNSESWLIWTPDERCFYPRKYIHSVLTNSLLMNERGGCIQVTLPFWAGVTCKRRLHILRQMYTKTGLADLVSGFSTSRDFSLPRAASIALKERRATKFLGPKRRENAVGNGFECSSARCLKHTSAETKFQRVPTLPFGPNELSTTTSAKENLQRLQKWDG